MPKKGAMPPKTTVLAPPLHCQECRRAWLDGGERWRLYVTDDAPAQTVPYCPECARREFDPD